MKGIVISHENGGTYVMSKNGGFKFVKGYENHAVGVEVELDESKYRKIKKDKSHSKLIFRYAPAFAAVCLIVAVAFGIYAWVWNAGYHSVYVEMNASVELRFNRFNRLISARAINDDGAEIIYNLQNGLSSSEAVVQAIIDIYENDNSDAQAALISFSCYGTKYEESPTVYAKLHDNYLEHIDIMQLYAGYYRERARELDVTPGRLKLAEQAYQNGYTSFNDLLEKPLEVLKYIAN